MTATATQTVHPWRVHDTHTGQTILTSGDQTFARSMAAAHEPRLEPGSAIRRWAVERP
ncbi:hypothetical protein DVS28_b0166 (plasmid) [Euzebya pacifica]|uniref:Uncharacterized protein n=1 Tax=Euzebya pacifica TaxID=1608957 RepID=A0A346Y639_9ACTN|nr:hypothetical protein [Euzebya pacifica]AXV09936.1 hypothetical protein DVS28_b0166 [Euzebya pacifica]